MRAALAPRVGAPASTSAPAPAQPRGAVRVCAARSPWTAARRVASSETRLSLASPRGVSPRPHAVASPPSSVTARRASGRDVSSRASSLAGWTHGFGDADDDGDRRDAAFAGDASDASSRPRAATNLAPFEVFVARLGVFFASAAAPAASAVGRADAGDVEAGGGAASTSVAFRRLLLLCVAAFVTALLAQHIFTWPGFAAVAPAAAFATGNLGAAAFPIGALTKTAAFLASTASQTVSLAGAAVASAASGALGYAAAAEKASAEMAVLRAELGELRVAVATAAAAARRSGENGEAAAAADVQKFDAARVDGVLAALGAKVATATAETEESVESKTETENETDALLRVIADAEASARQDSDAEVSRDDAKAAELAELRTKLARLRAVWAPELDDMAPSGSAGAGDARRDEEVDWNARARSNAVWTPPGATPSRPRLDADEKDVTKSDGFVADESVKRYDDWTDTSAYGQADSTKRAATLKALADARADLAALRLAKLSDEERSVLDVPVTPGSLEARLDLADASTDYASIAKARALWSPGAPGDAPGDAGGDAGAATSASFRLKKRDFDADEAAERRAAGASDEAAETARLEAEDRAWRRRLRMDAASEDPFGDAR
jgi:hypothetical protein